jgi:DNA repair protein SbcD/Mre11
MKFLHTADWHLGKILHRHELTPEIILFFDWLVKTIISEKVDVLLISGDIFDLANPANKDLKLYYHFLYRLAGLKIKTIITGGNHDSVSLLNAPAELLDTMNIHVIGGVPEDFEKQLIPITNDKGDIEAIVLAVPFLREKDLKVSFSADQEKTKSDTTAAAIKSHYDRLVDLSVEKYGMGIPLIAMGHLFMQGAITSDSEREIHVGTLQGIDGSMVHSAIDYMALGHIHKPQRISKQDHIRYSGSPIFLDFSEAGYEKVVISVDLHEGNTTIHPIKIPVFRQLLRLSGRCSEIKDTLQNYKNPYDLSTYVEIDVMEHVYNVSINYEVEAFKDQQNSDYKIIKSKITLPGISVIDQEYAEDWTASFTPADMIKRRLDSEIFEDDYRQELVNVYNEILDIESTQT